MTLIDGLSCSMWQWHGSHWKDIAPRRAMTDGYTQQTGRSPVMAVSEKRSLNQSVARKFEPANHIILESGHSMYLEWPVIADDVVTGCG